MHGNAIGKRINNILPVDQFSIFFGANSERVGIEIQDITYRIIYISNEKIQNDTIVDGLAFDA